MLEKNAIKLNVLLVLILMTTAAAAAYGQRIQNVRSGGLSAPLMQERRPFDFSDDFYHANGVWAYAVLDRQNGTGPVSVPDYISDPNFREVRILATRPAYGAAGELYFWNPYGELTRDAFIKNGTGEIAIEAAYRFPVYFFPSETAPGKDRQAVLIETDESYKEKNPLGLGLAVLIEYTPEIRSDAGTRMMAELAKRNGLSLDGTPIIRTAKEIYELTRLGMVAQRVRGSEDPHQSPFVVAKIILDPTLGAIAPDAYLSYITDQAGQPLGAEREFLRKFECLQKGDADCK